MFGNHFEDSLLHFLATTGCASTSQLMQLHPDMGYKTNHSKISRMAKKRMIQVVGCVGRNVAGRSSSIWALTPHYARLLSAPEYLKTSEVFLEKGLLKAEYVLANQDEHYPYLFKDKKALFERYVPWPFPLKGAIPLGTDTLVCEDLEKVVCCLPVVDTRVLAILSSKALQSFRGKVHLKLLCHLTHQQQLENRVLKITSVEDDVGVRNLTEWKHYFNGLPLKHPMKKKVQLLIDHMIDNSMEQASLSDASGNSAPKLNIEIIPYVTGAVFRDEG